MGSSTWTASAGCIRFFSLLLIWLAQPCLAEPLSEQTPKENPVPVIIDQSVTALPVPEDAEIRRDPLDQSITFLKASDLAVRLDCDPGFAALRAQRRHADLAIYYLSAYRAVFHLRDPTDEMFVKGASTDALGYTHVRLRQVYAGLPVWGAELIVHFDAADRIYLVNGHYLPTPDGVNRQPHLSEAQALGLAARSVGQTQCGDCRIQLMVFGVGRPKPALAYQVSVRLAPTEQWIVFIDAESGQVLDRYSAVPTAAPDIEITQ
jgi:hypothetical protein